MPTAKEQITTTILAVILVLLFFGILFLVMLAYYNFRRRQTAKEKKEMQAAFEEQLQQARLEIQHQTLTYLAQEIHDNVGQILSLAKIQLSSFREGEAIDFTVRREFDYAVVEYANGKPLNEILGISYRGPNGQIVHTPDRPSVADLDAMPDVVDVYKRDLDPRRYNVPFLLYPFVSLYTTRGCPAQCTFCLWPQKIGRAHV